MTPNAERSSDRAAVAREVLTEFTEYFSENFASTVTHRDLVAKFTAERYPSPPAPETVTVDGTGEVVTWQRKNDTVFRWERAGKGYVPGIGDAFAFLDRIASDARRIAELEKQADVDYEARKWDEADARHEIAQLTRERDAALRALEEKGDGHGAKEHVSGNAGDAGSSPAAPIPLGATLHVPGDPDSPYERVSGGWIRECTPRATRVQRLEKVYRDDDAAWGNVLTQYYHARHPVASRAMVERVARALFGQMWWDDLDPSKRAMYLSDSRAALRAAGFTVEDAS